MRLPFDPAGLPVKAIARAIVDRAAALGLLWGLRPATVAVPATDGSTRAILDGDTKPIRVVSMVGAVSRGARVMVLVTPPAGHHIVGFLGPIRPTEARRSPTLLNGWENYGASVYLASGYWKDSDGVGHMTGLIRNGTVANGTVLFELPVGYRPENREVHTVYGGAGPARLDLHQNGDVAVWANASASYLSLAGVTWKCER